MKEFEKPTKMGHSLYFGKVLALSALSFMSLQDTQAQLINKEKEIPSLVCKQQTMTSVLKKLETISNYKILFTYDEIKEYTVNADLKNTTVEEAIKTIIAPYPLSYSIRKNFITIKKVSDNKQYTEKRTIKGRILDENNQPLPGASISIEQDKTKGTVSDMNGNFTITTNKKETTINISYIGYLPITIKVSKKDDLGDIEMQPDNAIMDEVVVVGYGTAKRKDLTGAVSSVDERLMNESAATDIGSIIQGQVPGLQILVGSGSPGEQVQMQIRGVASLSGSTNPLIVVDDVAMPEDFSINDINPADVKSIDVLKGASSAAIYGSRAAAGVIMISTKRGLRNSKPSVDYSFTYGTRQLVSDINVLNTEEFKLLLLEATRNSAQESGYTDLSKYTYYKNFTTPGFFGEVNTPWMKLLMQEASVQSHNLSIRGGGKETSYSISYGHNQEDGMLVNTGNRRQTLNMNLNTNINPWLRVGATFRGNISKRGQTENFRVAAEARPDIPCYNEDGSYYVHEYDYMGEKRFETNPMIEAKERDNTTRGLGANLSAFLEANPWDNLHLRLQYSYNYSQQKERDFSPSKTFTGSGGYKGQKGQLTNREYSNAQQDFEARLFYNKKIKEHEFDITMVGSLTDNNNSSHSITFADFPDDKTQTSIYQGVTFKSQYGYDRGSLLLSGVLRANYKFKDRYLLTASYRADGSSRFSPSNRWSYFPSVAAGWILTEEKWLKKNPLISFLKLRASVGKVGMGYVSEYDWMTLYSSAEYLGKPAVVPGSMGNDELKWEGTIAYDLGLDFALFERRRVSGTLGFYWKKTDDLLYNYTLSPGIGIPSARVNFASIQNRGVEFDVTVNILDKRDLSWSVSFDISKNINKVTGLDNRFVSSPGSSSLRSTVIEEGKSLGLFYGYKTDGIFQSWDEINACEALNPDKPYQQKFSYDKISPGDIKLVDISGDGYVNLASNNYEDMTVLGSSLPDFTGGISTRFHWKGFTLSMQGTFSYGNMKSWEAEGHQFSFNPSRPKNLLSLSLKRWTPENKTNHYPKIKLNAVSYGMTDFWLHDASYFKIQNISLTYNFPQRLLKKIQILNRAELFASINNVYTFTSYPGPNPESYDSSNRIAGAAIDYMAYPQTRTYNFGLRISIK